MIKYYQPQREFNYCTGYRDKNIFVQRKVDDKKMARVVKPRGKKACQ